MADGSQIALGDQNIMVVSDLDAQLEQVNRPLLARIYVKRIGEAIETWRRDRTSEYLLRSAAHVLAATLALAAFLWVGKRAVRRIDRELDGRVKTQLTGLEAPLHADCQCDPLVECAAESATVCLDAWRP